MLLLKEKLTVEITDIYSVQVNLGGKKEHKVTAGAKQEMEEDKSTTVLR